MWTNEYEWADWLTSRIPSVPTDTVAGDWWRSRNENGPIEHLNSHLFLSSIRFCVHLHSTIHACHSICSWHIHITFSLPNCSFTCIYDVFTYVTTLSFVIGLSCFPLTNLSQSRNCRWRCRNCCYHCWNCHSKQLTASVTPVSAAVLFRLWLKHEPSYQYTYPKLTHQLCGTLHFSMRMKRWQSFAVYQRTKNWPHPFYTLNDAFDWVSFRNKRP